MKNQIQWLNHKVLVQDDGSCIRSFVLRVLSVLINAGMPDAGTCMHSHKAW